MSMSVGRTARVAKTCRVTKSNDIVRIAQNSAYLPAFSIILYKERAEYAVLVQKREICKPIELKSRKKSSFSRSKSPKCAHKVKHPLKSDEGC